MTPVGDMLVSYEADQMPTAVLERIGREALEDYDAGSVPPRQALRVMTWLLRIALHKIRALEGSA